MTTALVELRVTDPIKLSEMMNVGWCYPMGAKVILGQDLAVDAVRAGAAEPLGPEDLEEER